MSEPLDSPSVNLAAVTDLLDAWIDRHISPEAKTWLSERLDKVSAGDEKTLFLTFGMIPRKLGKADLELSELDQAASAKVRPRWHPTNWTVDQAARTRLVLALAAKPQEQFVTLLDKLFDSGEVGELVALYQALPVLPHQAAHALRTSEGTLSDIKSVFCAVAHHNPYPAEHLDENRWNQMVLKSLFIATPLWPIVGLDERANPALARMLVDYAHERWAAGQTVN
ncbi:MAG: EboA domain-containing protein, partial [Planctomycetaceae bacterium]|nr:EboA domain-containing protein [Planctomycetaceae bacterium]